MSKRTSYVPKHRHVPEPKPSTIANRTPHKVLRTSVLLSTVAVVTTGAAVSGGVLGAGSSMSSAAEDLGTTLSSSPAAQAPVVDREPITSRTSDRRASADPKKAAALAISDDAPAVTRSVDLADGDPRSIAQALMPKFGFSADQFGCLDSLWMRESGWSVSAHNASSGAHGIPQSLPGSKMASAGADWATNPVTQITWGLGYIQDRYGSPCGAWGHSQASGWY